MHSLFPLLPLPEVFLSILLKLRPAFPKDTYLTMALYLTVAVHLKTRTIATRSDHTARLTHLAEALDFAS